MQLPLIILTVLFFSIRLINLTSLPVFNDEAIYLHWGWIETHIPSQAFYSLFDAKQPLFMWIFGWAQNVISDPLLAGRIISVIAGYFTLTGLYLVGQVFNKKIAVIAGLLYCCIPLFLLYDRQALMESSVAAIGVWSFYLSWKLWKTNKTRYAIYLGAVLGTGFFIKSSSALFLVPVGLLIFKKPKVLIGFIVALIIVSPLFLQSQYWQTLPTNSRYSLTFGELFHFPWKIWLANVGGMAEIMWWQLTPLIFLAAIGGLLTTKKKEITVWLLIILLMVVLFTRNISPRYLVSFLPLVVILAANFLARWRPVFLLALIIPIGMVGLQIFNPISYFSQLKRVTKFSQQFEYVTGWTAGYGVKEAVNYIVNDAKGRLAIAGVRGDSGNPEDAVFVYLTQATNIKAGYLNRPICSSIDMPAYFISRDNQLAGMDRNLLEIKRFFKPERLSSVGVYRFKPCD